MELNRREAMILAAGAAGAAAVASTATPAAANPGGETDFVQVNMWDLGADAIAAFDMSNRVMLGTEGAARKDDPGVPMGFTLNKYVVPRGKVKFIATNTSTIMEHEMLIVPIKDVTQPLPYNTEIERFDEDAAGAIGEVHEVPPGETGTTTVDLEPGIYMLACNVPNHYAMGMWTMIVVI